MKVAIPLALSVAVPRLFAPLKKVTLPVGGPEPIVGATVAVSATFWNEVVLVGIAVSAVTVGGGWMTSTTAALLAAVVAPVPGV